MRTSKGTGPTRQYRTQPIAIPIVQSNVGNDSMASDAKPYQKNRKSPNDLAVPISFTVRAASIVHSAAYSAVSATKAPKKSPRGGVFVNATSSSATVIVSPDRGAGLVA